MLSVRGQAEPFSHTDRNLLRKVGEPTPNPTALAAMAEAAGKSAIDVASASVDSRGKAGLSGASTG